MRVRREFQRVIPASLLSNARRTHLRPWLRAHERAELRSRPDTASGFRLEITRILVALVLGSAWIPMNLAAAHGEEQGPEPLGEPPAEAASSGEVISVFEGISEAAESTVAGGFLKFFELGPKIRDVLAAHNKGDDATAVATGVGTVTEYGLALYLVEFLGVSELFMVELQPTIEWASQIGQAVAGTMGVTKVSEFSGELVEKTTHHSLAAEPHPETH